MLAQLTAVMRKEVRQTFRDRRMAALLVMAPILQLILLGYAVDLDVDHLRTAVVDLDRSKTSRQLIRGLFADGTLIHAYDTSDPNVPLTRGDAHLVIVAPDGLARDIQAGNPAQIQVLVNGTDPIRAQVAINTSTQYFQQESLALLSRRMDQTALLQGQRPVMPSLRVAPRIYYNPRMKSSIYMVPGVAAVALLVVTTIVTAMGIAREKEMGTLEQVMITPIHPTVLLLGKTLPYALIGLVVTGLILAVGTNLFGVPIRGSLLVILVGTVLYLMSTLGVGVFISTVAQTQQQAILGGFFFLMPAILLSGFMSPVENMPTWIQPITWINPVRYFVEILRAALLKGAGFYDLWQPLLALLVFGMSILGLSSRRFHKQIA